MTESKIKEACHFHPGREATDAIMIEGGSVVKCCQACRNRILNHERYVCRYCGVPIHSPEDTSAVLEEAPHKFKCPRRENGEESSDSKP